MEEFSISHPDGIPEEDFTALCRMVQDRFGIILKNEKRLSLHARLAHRLGALGISTYAGYLDYIRSQSSGEELFRLVSNITNNETFFLRENVQLEAFSGFLQETKREKQRRGSNGLRVLSAGCSTGEEAYSLSMLVAETGLFSWGWEVEIIGLDIDKKALRTAEKAVYTGHSFRGLNGRREDFISRYFNRGGGDNYSVKPFLRSKVSFVHGNLLDPELFVCLGPVDAIFCRNVFIYMGDEAVSAAARNFHSCLDRAGYLFLGSAETLIQKTDLFAPEFTGGVVVYRKTNDDG